MRIMAILKPDKTSTLGGVTVNEYLLTQHNPNKINMPNTKFDKIIGVTVHNTDWINVTSGTTPAEQYTRATVNGNMNSVRVHYYVDNTCAWQNLPLDISGWHAADGNGDGNRKTISIECIMSSAYNDKDKASEDNCAKLAAALLKKYGLGIECLFTHTHWLNVRDGKKGTVDELNVMKNSYKWCPAYILPHWQAFKAKVQSYLNPVQTTNPKPTTTELYRIRKNWNDVASQIGAYASLENAKAACKPGYTIYNSAGVAVYTNPVPPASYSAGAKVSLNGTLYASASAKTGVKRSAIYYLYDGVLNNGRYRITNIKANCGKKPMVLYVTGWANKSDLSVIG